MTNSTPKFMRAALAALADVSALFLACTLLAALPSVALAKDGEAKKAFDIPAGDALPALKQFVVQSGEQLLYSAEAVQGVTTQAVKGTYTPREALDRMVSDTKLSVVADRKNGALSLVRDAGPNAPRVAQTEATTPRDQSKIEDGKLVLDKFEVFGSKSINLDLPRTRDDAQPYVVFNHDQIANSQAANLQDFFRTRLPMATQVGQLSFTGASALNSTVNLRGLGFNQTLILVDGRRLPAFVLSGAVNMLPPDPNGIPLEMIERIEILPSTASGIYGGGATGGVINIITRKDFSGAVLTTSYVNTFDTDTARRRVDFNASTSLNGGKTVLTLTASWQDARDLLVQDRDFAIRARQLAFANNPAAFTGTSTPPRGYTTNIRNQNGTNLVLKPQYGGAVLNSAFTSVPVGYAGIASDNAAAFVANAGRYNLDLPNDLGSRLANQITTASPITSLGFGLRQRFTPWLEGYVDYLRTDNNTRPVAPGFTATATLAATAPNNPFTTAINVAFPNPSPEIYNRSFNEQITNRLTGGLVAKLPGEWQGGMDFTWGRSVNISHNDSTALGDPDGPAGPAISYATALSTGALDVMRDLNLKNLDLAPYAMLGMAYENVGASVNQSVTARASGPTFHLPTGDIVFSTSAEVQKANTEPNIFSSPSPVAPQFTYFYTSGVSSVSRSVYAEARVPLLAAPQGQPKDARLELQVAARYDASEVRTLDNGSFPVIASPSSPVPTVGYLTRDFSASTHTAGLRYAPIPDLVFRASVGTGFLAPDMVQLSPTDNIPGRTFSNLVDPKRGGVLGSIGPVDVITGGNPRLRPEKSKSYSGGVILTPRFLPGFRLSVDYTRINKTDEITSLSFQQMLDFEDQIPGYIARAPLTPADQALGYTGGVVTMLSIRSINFARREVEAFDVQADYTRKTTIGEFRAYSIATFNRRFAGQVVPSAPILNEVGYNSSPLKWRGNAGLDWSRGSWSAGWNAQYYSAQSLYRITDTPAARATTLLTQGYDTFPAQMYHDAQVSYEWGRGGAGLRRMLSNVKLTVGLQNVFNREPPVQAGNVLRSGFQNIEDPRLRRYTLNLRKRF
jgi:outer membrane receptor protein involved in Fe transport